MQCWTCAFSPTSSTICLSLDAKSLMERGGRARDGGTFEERMGNIAVWNSVMDEDRYLTRRWNEFITA